MSGPDLSRTVVTSEAHLATMPAEEGRVTSRRYEMYGGVVRSDFDLSLPPVYDASSDRVNFWFHRAGEAADAPDWPGRTVLRRRCDCPHHQGVEVTRVTRGPRGTRFWYDEAGTADVPIDPRQVDVYPAHDGDARLLEQVLVGVVGTFVLTQLGLPCLHASAVATEAGAIAFVGPSGKGKSTLAAAFLQAGAALLSDDALPLETIGSEVWARPGVPFMKVWDPTAKESLGIDQDLPSLTRHVHKRRLDLAGRFAYSDRPRELRAVFVLDRHDRDDPGAERCAIERLGPTESLLALLSTTLNREILSAAENQLLLRVYTRLLDRTPVCRLRYQHGFAYQPRVIERIRDYLAER